MGKRSMIQLAYPFEERRLLEPKFGWRFPIIVQPKLDGERCRAVPTADGFDLLSSECNKIISVPHINKQLTDIFKSIPSMELDGELYIHGWDFSDLHSVISRQSDETRHEKSELMQFHIFDFVSSIQQLARTSQLSYYKGLDSDSIKLVPNTIAQDMSELMEAYNKYIDLGYEGIIVRHINAPYMRQRSRFMLKFKPKKSDYYKITGVIEAISNDGFPLNMIGAFSCIGNDGNYFKIGAGNLTHQERKDLWKDRYMILGKFCHVSYQNITAKGVPRFGLCKSIVDENPEEVSTGGIL